MWRVMDSALNRGLRQATRMTFLLCLACGSGTSTSATSVASVGPLEDTAPATRSLDADELPADLREVMLHIYLAAATVYGSTGEFPPEIEASPATAPCELTPWPNASPWTALGFSPSETRYSFALEHRESELWLLATQSCEQVNTWLLRMGVTEDGMLYREDVFWGIDDEPELPQLSPGP